MTQRLKELLKEVRDILVTEYGRDLEPDGCHLFSGVVPGGQVYFSFSIRPEGVGSRHAARLRNVEDQLTGIVSELPGTAAAHIAGVALKALDTAKTEVYEAMRPTGSAAGVTQGTNGIDHRRGDRSRDIRSATRNDHEERPVSEAHLKKRIRRLIDQLPQSRFSHRYTAFLYHTLNLDGSNDDHATLSTLASIAGATTGIETTGLIVPDGDAGLVYIYYANGDQGIIDASAMPPFAHGGRQDMN